MTTRFLASASIAAMLLASSLATAQTPAAPPTDPAAPPPTLPGDPAAPTAGDTAMPAAPVAAPAPTAADVDKQLTTLFGDPAPYKAFLTDLQKATAEEDKKTVAAMVSYPLKTKVAGKDETFEKAADLVKAYDDVFTPAILVAIKSQTYETLFANDMGVMIGTGQVWFSEIGEGEEKAVKIIGINQPTP
jgi:hypothetical protein